MSYQSFPSRALALAMLLLLFALPATAQLQSGNLYGTTVGPEGQPMPGVTVVLTGAGASLTQMSDANGKFRFPGLSPGTYAVETSLEGFAVTRQENIDVNVGRNTVIELPLQISDVMIVVAEKPPLLDPRRTGREQTVTLEELERIPSVRDPWGVLQSTPGVLMDRMNVGGSESGQQSQFVGPGSLCDQAVWSLDGMVLTDMAALGSSPGYYDFDAFEEMQVTTGGSDAATATGGVVLNMVTKRGTNEWRGSARYYVSDDSTQSDLEFDRGDLGQAGPWNNGRAQTAFKQGNRIVKIEDLGVELGGPLVRDRIWVWGSYAKPEIDLLTISDFSDKTTLEDWNVKVNAQVAANNSATLFAWQSDKVKIGRNAGPLRPQETTWNQSKFGPDPTAYKVEDTHIFDSSFFVTGMYSKVNGGFQLAPQGGDKLPFRDATLQWHNSFLLQQIERPQEQGKLDAANFFNTGSLSHELKYGAGYRTAEQSSPWCAGRAAASSWTSADRTCWPWRATPRPTHQGRVHQRLRSGHPRGGQPHGQRRPAVGPPDRREPALRRRRQSRVPRAAARGPLRRRGRRLHLERRLAAARPHLRPRRRAQDPAARQLLAVRRPARHRHGRLPQPSRRARLPLLPDHQRRRPHPGARRARTRGGSSQRQRQSLHPPAAAVVRRGCGLRAPRSATSCCSASSTPCGRSFVVGLNLSYRQLTGLLEAERLVFDVGDPFAPGLLDSVGRVHRRSDYVEQTATAAAPDGRTYTVHYWELRPGVSTRNGFRLENGDREQEFLGASLTFNKRLSNRWMMRGNVSWQDWTWNIPDSENEDPTDTIGGGTVDGTEVLQGSGIASGAKGNVFINSEWSYSLNGMYQIAPDRGWGFNVAANLTGRQGYPLRYVHRVNRATISDNGGSGIDIPIQADPDGFRYPDLHVVDLRAEKELHLQRLRPDARRRRVQRPQRVVRPAAAGRAGPQQRRSRARDPEPARLPPRRTAQLQIARLYCKPPRRICSIRGGSRTHSNFRIAARNSVPNRVLWQIAGSPGRTAEIVVPVASRREPDAVPPRASIQFSGSAARRREFMFRRHACRKHQ